MSVLEGDDRVDFVDVIGAIPEDSGEVVGVRRVVQLDLVTETSMFGKRVHLSFIIHHLVV